MVRLHQPVPEIEIEAEIPLQGFMVHDMVRGSVHKKPDPRLGKPAPVVFIPGMTNHIEPHLPDHENPKGQWVNGK